MLKIGRKFINPHFCPDCHKLVIVIQHPSSKRCSCCHRRHRRHSPNDNSTKRSRRKYNSNAYHQQANAELDRHGWCALCGSTKNLTCHHAVQIRTGEWKGKHLTVLCNSCHQIWETKVNILRSKYVK